MNPKWRVFSQLVTDGPTGSFQQMKHYADDCTISTRMLAAKQSKKDLILPKAGSFRNDDHWLRNDFNSFCLAVRVSKATHRRQLFIILLIKAPTAVQKTAYEKGQYCCN